MTVIKYFYLIFKLRTGKRGDLIVIGLDQEVVKKAVTKSKRLTLSYVVDDMSYLQILA